ncbi:MAG: ATP-binding protein [Candidatus Bathyarchaeia archaeon]|jgi:AAA+ ATPase superfamily predicted ATPase
MIQLFADRQQETKFLEQHYTTQTPELIIIYGRRRVGKTELTLQFSKNKPHIYFLGDHRPETELINELKQKMSLYLGNESFAKLAVKDWIELFEEFTKWNKTFPALIIIDEFPALIEANRAVPSIFQKIWDQNLKNTDTKLILLGSSVSTMETEVLDYKSPLYGRRTAQWKLTPLKVFYLKPFYPNYSLETLIHVYACLGGIPAYLQKFNPDLNFWENVEQKILTKGEFLYEEAEFLLREELREPRNYALILQTIAQGARAYGEILNRTGLDKSIISKYTSVLEDLGFIERTYPMGIAPKPRKGLYTIADNYLNFWFKYVFPNRTELEAGNTQGVLNKIKLDYNTYLGYAFEQVAAEFLTEMKNQGKLPFTFTAIGKWWYKNKEIDIVALDEEKQAAAFIETKWSNLSKIDCARIVENLKAKTVDFRWDRKRESYGIIAKKIAEKNLLTRHGCFAFDLADFESLMQNVG